MKSLNKKEKQINDKISKGKKEAEKKFFLQKQRFSLLQRERDEQMKVLDEKLSKSTRSAPESRQSSSFSKWRDHSKSRIEKIKQEEEKYIGLKLELYNKKIQQSAKNHKHVLEEKTRRLLHHNARIEQVKKEKIQLLKDINDDQLVDFFNKHKSASARREKRQNEFSNKLEKKHKDIFEKKLRVDMNKVDEQQEMNTKIDTLEKKSYKTQEVLQRNKLNWKSRLEIKQERERLKSENSLEKINRNKRLALKTKEDILKRHQEMENRLRYRKLSLEQKNEKFRDVSMKEAIEKDKIKGIKFRISKSKTPINLQSMLSIYS